MDKKRGKHSNSEDATLFREAMRDVEPLTSNKARLQKPAARARAQFRRRDNRQVLEESLSGAPGPDEIETGEELLFQRPQVKREVFRRLRRGRFAIQDEIDLHGLTADEAQEALREFIADCRRHRLHCVRVVHGKGLGSGPNGPVLKQGVNRWLRRWDDVLAFCSTPARDGGTGALYVLLKR